MAAGESVITNLLKYREALRVELNYIAIFESTLTYSDQFGEETVF